MSKSLEEAVNKMGLSDWVKIAKKYTENYAKNHKGRNKLEKECIKNGYLIKRQFEIFPDSVECEKNKLRVIALDSSSNHCKNKFIIIY